MKTQSILAAAIMAALTPAIAIADSGIYVGSTLEMLEYGRYWFNG